VVWRHVGRWRVLQLGRDAADGKGAACEYTYTFATALTCFAGCL
jgi:hypothetical protein